MTILVACKNQRNNLLNCMIMAEKITKNKIDYVFETSWEVCNKVGGIYTVLASKAQNMKAHFGDKLIFIGPDVWQTEASPWFIEDNSLCTDWKEVLLENEGISVRIGRWDLPSSPLAILVDFASMSIDKNEIYGSMWEKYQVESIDAYGDYDESCLFACCAAKVIKNFIDFNKLTKKKIITHFHEWTTGMGLLYAKSNIPNAATVFTTHATTVGRSIAGNHKPLYSQLSNYNGDQMSKELNVAAKHSLEKAAATYADLFTTVSHITAKECKQLLGVEPLVTPNGFDNSLVPQGKIFTQKAKQAKEKLKEVAEALLGYSLSKDTFFMVTSGRYEYRNKGIDVFIDALNRLNDICDKKTKKEVVAFVMVPAWVKGPRLDLQTKLTDEAQKNEILPNPVLTHELYNMDSDNVLNQLKYLNINNKKDDTVKVIFVPSYLNGDDGIFNMTYYDLLIGMDLTVFPSYYEPWGYTPHESIAFGVPTITTVLSGFGQWMQETARNEEDKDTVVVIERNDYNFIDVSQALSGSMYVKIQQSATTKKRYATNALSLAETSNWDAFIKYYEQAYLLALKNKK